MEVGLAPAITAVGVKLPRNPKNDNHSIQGSYFCKELLLHTSKNQSYKLSRTLMYSYFFRNAVGSESYD